MFFCSVQIVGMSATLPNVYLLARWLKADLYHTDYRPVPLTETVKISTAIYNNQMQKIRDMEPSKAIKVTTSLKIFSDDYFSTRVFIVSAVLLIGNTL